MGYHCNWQDVQYADIDYMDQQRDFTYDKEKYAGLPEFIQEMKNEGLHYVVILVNFQYFFLSSLFVLTLHWFRAVNALLSTVTLF